MINFVNANILLNERTHIKILSNSVWVYFLLLAIICSETRQVGKFQSPTTKKKKKKLIIFEK